MLEWPGTKLGNKRRILVNLKKWGTGTQMDQGTMFNTVINENGEKFIRLEGDFRKTPIEGQSQFCNIDIIIDPERAKELALWMLNLAYNIESHREDSNSHILWERNYLKGPIEVSTIK
jgi:hypothetical protein